MVRTSATTNRLSEALLGLVSLIIRERPRDLTLTAAATLTTLERCGPRPLTQLALTEGVAQPSMTVLVRQLESLGLVERRSDPADGRVAVVALTEEGGRYLKTARRDFSRRLAALLEQLPESEVAALEATMPALENLLHVVDSSAAPGARGVHEGAGQ